MPKFPVYNRSKNTVVISPASPNSIGHELNGMGFTISAAGWPTANKAIGYPVIIHETTTITKMFIENGSSVAGSVDVGIYHQFGTLITSLGGVLQSGTNAIQELNIADTVLEPGFYYFVMVMTNVTGSTARFSPTSAVGRVLGVVEMTNAYPLPASGTFAANTLTAGAIPGLFATRRSFI